MRNIEPDSDENRRQTRENDAYVAMLQSKLYNATSNDLKKDILIAFMRDAIKEAEATMRFEFGPNWHILRGELFRLIQITKNPELAFNEGRSEILSLRKKLEETTDAYINLRDFAASKGLNTLAAHMEKI